MSEEEAITVSGIYARHFTASQIRNDLDRRAGAMKVDLNDYDLSYRIDTELFIDGTVMHYEASLDAYRRISD